MKNTDHKVLISMIKYHKNQQLIVEVSNMVVYFTNALWCVTFTCTKSNLDNYL